MTNLKWTLSWDLNLCVKYDRNAAETRQGFFLQIPTSPLLHTLEGLAIRVMGSEGSLLERKKMVTGKNGGASAPRQNIKKKKRKTLDRRSEENLEWDTLFCTVNNSCLRCPWARCSTADCSDGADWHQTVVVLGSSQALMSVTERVWRALLLPNESARQSFPG